MAGSKQRSREKAKPYFRFKLRSGPAPPTVTLDISSVLDASFTQPLHLNLSPRGTAFQEGDGVGSMTLHQFRRTFSDSGPPPKRNRTKSVRFVQEPEIKYFSCSTPSYPSTPGKSSIPWPVSFPVDLNDNTSTGPELTQHPWSALEWDDPCADIPEQLIRGRVQHYTDDNLLYDTDSREDADNDREELALSRSLATSLPMAIPRAGPSYNADPSWLSSTLKEFDASEVLRNPDFEPVAPRSFRVGQPFSFRERRVSDPVGAYTHRT